MSQRFHFRTRKQELNSVEGSESCRFFSACPPSHSSVFNNEDRFLTFYTGTRANITYLDQLQKFHKQHGNNLNRFPSVDKRPLDLYKLRKAVETRGGFEKVCKLKKWAEIGRDLGYSGKIMSSLSTSLKNSYQRWLYPYEEYLKQAKPAVYHQLELEYGGPLTPSPANSPLKRSTHTPSSVRGDSPAVRASADALNASMRDSTEFEKNTPILEPPQLQAPRPSGFTPVNPGGFTPVNAGPTVFTPVQNGLRGERDGESSFTPCRTIESPMSSAKNTPEYRPSGLSAAPLTNDRPPNPLKRQLSHDSLDSRKENGQSAESENGGRRSKRLKKGRLQHIPIISP